jgi:hypothetical protein
MYAYSELETLLSPSSVDILSEVGVYDIYKAEAENIIFSYTGLTAEELTATAKVPFVFLLEYLVYNKLTVTSPEHGSKVESAYKTALSLLDKIVERNIVSPTTRIGLINSDYTEY